MLEDIITAFCALSAEDQRKAMSAFSKNQKSNPMQELSEYCQTFDVPLPSCFYVPIGTHSQGIQWECELKAAGRIEVGKGKSKKRARAVAAEKILNLLDKEY